MKKLLILFSLGFSIISCKEPQLLNNGLTKKASKITEYTLQMTRDSKNNIIQDTLIITEKKYNDNDQVISRNQRNLFSDEIMEIEYIYDNNKKVKKEIVTLSTENSNYTVDYFYKDTLLIKAQVESQNDIFSIRQIEQYEYNENNILTQHTLLQQYIAAETNDTITNTLEISKYNKKEFITESKLSDLIQPERNKKIEYNYNRRMLVTSKEFNYKDSLILTTEYKYEFDKFHNWIRREAFENKKLNYMLTRIIEYR